MPVDLFSLLCYHYSKGCEAMETGLKIKRLRENFSLSQSELASKVGYKDRSSIAKIESGLVELSQSKLHAFADVFGVSVAYLLGAEKTWNLDPPGLTSGELIPVFGDIMANLPIDAHENIVDWLIISAKLANTGKFFAFKAHGDSMCPRIIEDDVLIVRKQNVAETGDIVVLTNNKTAEVKKFMAIPPGILLISFNAEYMPVYFSNKEIATLPVKILCNVVESRRKF
jgi:repressor LexA